MKIATWNVNSLRVRLPQVLDWMQEQGPDLLCVQETKLPDDVFPAEEIEAAGYRCLYSGQKTYNGVAILSKTAGIDAVTDLPGLDDPQRRVMAATFNSLRVLNVYVPNGQSVGSDKYQYKLDWLNKLIAYVKRELATHTCFVLLGDFNIAPEDQDVHEPAEWQGQVLFSEPERAAFKKLIGVGLHDSFRRFDQEPNTFSWWDYRAASFRRNRGLRIDHILASDTLINTCQRCYVDKAPRKLERPSDHAPVVAEFNL